MESSKSGSERLVKFPKNKRLDFLLSKSFWVTDPLTKFGRVAKTAKTVVKSEVITNIIIGTNKFCQYSIFLADEPITNDSTTVLMEIIMLDLLSANIFCWLRLFDKIRKKELIPVSWNSCNGIFEKSS